MLTLVATEELHRMNKVGVEGGSPPHSRSPECFLPSTGGSLMPLESIDLRVMKVVVVVVAVMVIGETRRRGFQPQAQRRLGVARLPSSVTVQEGLIEAHVALAATGVRRWCRTVMIPKENPHGRGSAKCTQVPCHCHGDRTCTLCTRGEKVSANQKGRTNSLAAHPSLAIGWRGVAGMAGDSGAALYVHGTWPIWTLRCNPRRLAFVVSSVFPVFPLPV
ncbi:hypothetical protein BHE74_00002817 [Ensete ventricosum]|nr:hypothetical protein GW17_00007126 [Ensete ventricosum]RWW88314.1 hypothetical protein BHE74_00002817 [Ensete ventricosum]